MKIYSTIIKSEGFGFVSKAVEFNILPMLRVLNFNGKVTVQFRWLIWGINFDNYDIR